MSKMGKLSNCSVTLFVHETMGLLKIKEKSFLWRKFFILKTGSGEKANLAIIVVASGP